MANFKKLLFVTALLLVCFGAKAQFQIGVKGGLNVSTISGLEISDNNDIRFSNMDYRPGFHIGVLAQYLFTPKMGIESGLYVSRLGATSSTKEMGYRSEESATPYYLQMPALFLYKFQFTPDFALYPTAGMYFGYGVGGKYSSKEYSNGEFRQISEDEGDYFSNYIYRFDMGLSAGVNLQYKKFLFGITYEAGLFPINKDRDFDNDNSFTARNENFKFSVGYLFQ